MSQMAAARRRGEPGASPPRGYLRQTPRPRSASPGFGNPRSPEGFLFPDTYFVFETDPAAALVEKQLEDFRAKWAKVDLATRARRT